MFNKENFSKWFDKNYTVNQNNKIKSVKSNRFFSENEICKNYMKMCEDACFDVDYNEQEVINEIQTKYNKQDEKPQKTCREWLIEQLKGNKHWKFNNAMTEIEYDATTSGIYVASDIDEMYERMVEFNSDTGKPFEVGTIKAVLHNMSKDALSNYLSEVYNKIKYDPDNEKDKDIYLKGLYDFLKPTESYEIFKTLVSHWAWMVKRKILGKSVRNHIWINFYGASGLGKTKMINKMCNVMDEFVSTTGIAKLFDDTKEIKRLTEKYILVFDELAVNGTEPGDGSLAADDLAILKQIITGDKLDARVYGTQQQARKRITFSCISSANYHLYDTIFDEQTMRRFFEFHCTAEKPDSYDEINKLHEKAVLFWRGINENDDNGYWVESDKEIWNEINNTQKEYYPTKTTVSQWLIYNKIISGEHPAAEFYSEYVEWCNNNGFKSKKTKPAFIEELKHRFPQFISPKDGILRITLENNDNVVPSPKEKYKPHKLTAQEEADLAEVL